MACKINQSEASVLINNNNNNSISHEKEEKPRMEITFEESALMKELEERVDDLDEEMRDKYCLIRFLRARDCDIDKAEQMLRKSAKWFHDHNASSYREGYILPQTLVDDYKTQVLGMDCHGHPDPWVFQYAFSFVKPWLAAKTLDKINILGNKPKTYLSTLKAHIPQDLIPSELIC